MDRNRKGVGFGKWENGRSVDIFGWGTTVTCVFFFFLALE